MTDLPPKHLLRARRGLGRVTLSDVANVAGVSQMTASRALNKPHMVSPALVERVKAAVLETGYVTNMLASGLASTQSYFIAVVVPSIASLIYLEFLQTLRAELSSAGYQVILGESDYAKPQDPGLIEALIGRRPDAIVIVGTVQSEQVRAQLAASGIPVVETWDLSAQPLQMLVGFSQHAVGCAAAEYLVGKGYRRLALIGADDQRAAVRTEGFMATIRKLDAAMHVPSKVIPAPSTMGAGRQALAQLLAEYGELDAIFCTSDMVALGVLTEAKARGLKVPQQLAVMGYGDLNFAADTDPPLSTVRADGRAIAVSTAQLILAHLQGRATGTTVDVGFSIVHRGSA
ncbi:LacI family DNA-binding transcriptional regulator [Pseudomonas sp. C2L12B]|uniref:LacI family DNA-binding transcriptional regulator n=1 Tax=Pseudomonas typographi TaxID=2715964 RepID=A0ABR7Z1F2_9PSED|nr:LacI family DNA-binding transcriptional regulator [Pseudomonas typographi]MBD1589722.1 LacI family DNA-binding transcriptional regulator [Pseudomonas typographi]MBD1599199.1 LacI family DNA-binding transcriptional regulator [Pseudomonas typographi]